MKNYIIIILLAFAKFANAQSFETIFEDNTYQLTGVAVSKSGRVFTNYPRWHEPYRYVFVEVGKHDITIQFLVIRTKTRFG